MARPLLYCTFATLLLGSSAACDRNAPTSDSVVLADSAGVQIVETTSPQWDSVAAWRLSEQPSLQLGAVAGADAQMFDRIVDVALPADGRIWVANGGDQTIRIFEGDGTYVRSLGGAGQGPGEFSSLATLSVRDGKVVAGQGLRGPLSIYAQDGSLQTTPSVRARPGLVAPDLAGIVQDGASSWAVVRHYAQGRPIQIGLFEQETPVYLLPFEGGEPTELGVFPASRFVGVADPEASTWQEFGPSLHVAACSHTIIIGWPVTSEVREFTTAGTLNRIIRWHRDPRPVTESQRQAYRDRMLTFPEGVRIPERARARQQALATGMVFPDHHPSYRRVLCDAEDRIWVQHENADIQWANSGLPGVPLAATLWDVIDQDGRWLGSLQTPERFTPMAISGDRVAGLYMSELDVHYVRIYDLIRPR